MNLLIFIIFGWLLVQSYRDRKYPWFVLQHNVMKVISFKITANMEKNINGSGRNTGKQLLLSYLIYFLNRI